MDKICANCASFEFAPTSVPEILEPGWCHQHGQDIHETWSCEDYQPSDPEGD